jgi:hypothetical protein
MQAMQLAEKCGSGPDLKSVVIEASQALARLDADRLEELALSCQALNRDTDLRNPGQRANLARQAHEAARDMAVFSRVLEATRANLNVMHRLRELREGRLEYRDSAIRAPQWNLTRTAHGDN